MEILKIEDYGYENLQDLVYQEIELIKQNFDISKLYHLNVGDIRAIDTSGCIYGNLAGDCNSVEVSNFIENRIPVCFTSVDMNNFYRTPEEYRSCFFQTPLELYIQAFPDEDQNENDDSEESLERITEVLKLLKQ